MGSLNEIEKTKVDIRTAIENTGIVVNDGLISYAKYITDIIPLPTKTVKNMKFANSTWTVPPEIDTTGYTDMNGIFLACTNLRYISKLNTENVKDLSYAFRSCYALESIPLLDCGNVEYLQYTFEDCNNLVDIGGFFNLGKYRQLTLNRDFDGCYNISTQSLKNIINNLYDRTSNGYPDLTLKFERQVFNRLLEEDIAIATNKGWILASYA